MFGDEGVDGRVEFGFAGVVVNDRMGACLKALGRRFGFAVFFAAEFFERFFAVAPVLGAKDHAVIAGTEVGVDVKEAEILIGRDAFEIGDSAGSIDDDHPTMGGVDRALSDVGKDVLSVSLAQNARKLLHVRARNVHLQDFEDFSERIGKEESFRTVTAFEVGGGGSFSGSDGTGEADDETRTHGGHVTLGYPKKYGGEYTGKRKPGKRKIPIELCSESFKIR